MILSIGEILVDIFDDGNKQTVLPGGAPFNVACNALLYTNDVAFIGAVGKDDNGRMLLKTAEGKGFKYLNIDVLDNRDTTKAIVTLNNGERSFRFERSSGADYCLDISSIDFNRIKDNDIVHIGSLMLSEKEGIDFYHKLVKKLRASKGVKISFDINYRDDIFSSPDEAKKILIDALKEADILKFSKEEIEILTNKEDILLGLKELLNEKQIAVVTLGKDGSFYYHNGHVVKASSFPVKPIDTTGAGDAFYSYFLYALNEGLDLSNDKEIKNALIHANVVGGMATLKKGAIGVAPTKEEIEAFLSLQK